MTKKKLYEYALDKWGWIVDNWDYTLSRSDNSNKLREAIPILNTLPAGCSYCSSFQDGYCNECPLKVLMDGTCGDVGTVYFKWDKAVTLKVSAQKLAEEMFDIIIDSADILFLED